MDEIRHLGTDLIGDYAEGLLDPAARGEADRHLQSCEACRRELEAARAYFGEMAALPIHRAPDRFLSRVHGRIAKASPWRRLLAVLSSPRLLPVPLAALSVILLGVYFAYVSRSALDSSSVPTVAYAPAAPAVSSSQPADLESKEAADLAIKAAVGPASEEEADPVTTELADRPAEEVAAAKVASNEFRQERLAKNLASRLGKKADVAKAKSKPASPEIISSSRKHEDPLDEWEEKYGNSPMELAMEGNPRKGRPAGLAGKREPIASEAGGQGKSGAPPFRMEDGAVAMAPAPRVASTPPGEPPSPASARAPARPASGSASAGIPPGYSLEVSGELPEDKAFRDGLQALGIAVLARRRTGDWDLEVPVTRIPGLEAYLRGLGRLIPSHIPLQGGKDGAPFRLTVRMRPGPSNTPNPSP